MGRFEKLRWVPMLIQAYYDARLKMATHQPGIQEKKDNIMLQTDNQQTQDHEKPQLHSRLKLKHRNGKQNSGKKPNPTKISAKGKDEFTAQLLREVRATKQKLKGLDEIQQQLNGLRSSLNDFNGRFDELQAISDPVSTNAKTDHTADLNVTN